MTNLFDPVYLTRTGEPEPGHTAVQLFIDGGGRGTPRQMAEVEAIYADFCTEKRLSLVAVHDVTRRLSDGSQVRINSIYGVDRVYATLEDADDLEPAEWIAYGVYTDMEWLDIYDRIVIGGLGGGAPPGGPEEPEFDPPIGRPLPPSADHISDPGFTYNSDVTNVPGISTTYTSSLSGAVSRSGTGTNSFGPPSTYSVGGYIFATGGVKTVFVEKGKTYWVSVTGDVGDESTWQKFGNSGPYFSVCNGSGPGNDWVPGDAVDTAATEALNLEITAWLAGLFSGYESAYAVWLAAAEIWDDAYRSAYNTWYNNVWKKWRDRFIEGFPTKPGRPLTTLRRAARFYQLESLRRSLDAGVRMPHLAARYLACPFNISTKPDGALSDGPSNPVTASPPTGIAHREITYTFKNAVRESLWDDNLAAQTVFDLVPFGRRVDDEPHLLGRDFASPSNLFGWEASGKIQRLARYREYHAGEPAYVDPRSMSGVSFRARGGYQALIEKGVLVTDDQEARVCTDGYLPPGTVLTMVQFEYEVFDRYSDAWIWTPHVHITMYDSLWLEAPGEYSLELAIIDPVNGEKSPRAMRFRKAFEQTRNKDQTWTEPKNVPIELAQGKRWEMEVTAGAAFMHPEYSRMWHHPTGIAILEKTSPAAAPRYTVNPFPFGAAAIWDDYPGLDEWIESSESDVFANESLGIAALRAVNKLKNPDGSPNEFPKKSNP